MSVKVMEKNNKAFSSGRISPNEYASFVIKSKSGGKITDKTSGCRISNKSSDK